jgi:ribosome-associated protein
VSVKKPAKKVTAKVAAKAKPASKKALAKKVVATKTSATKPATTKKATAKRVVSKVAPVKKDAVKKATVKNTIVKKATAKTTLKKPLAAKKITRSALPARTTSATEKLRGVVLKALDDLKAKDVVVIDVTARTSITDELIFASGTSTRHVKSLADSVVKAAKAIQMPPIGTEGEKESEWVLVDLADIVVHVMLPKAREFYALERMWSGAADIPNIVSMDD